jgi:hypothetical protein
VRTREETLMPVFERDDLALHLLDEEGSSGRFFT